MTSLVIGLAWHIVCVTAGVAVGVALFWVIILWGVINGDAL